MTKYFNSWLWKRFENYNTYVCILLLHIIMFFTCQVYSDGVDKEAEFFVVYRGHSYDFIPKPFYNSALRGSGETPIQENRLRRLWDYEIIVKAFFVYSIRVVEKCSHPLVPFFTLAHAASFEPYKFIKISY